MTYSRSLFCSFVRRCLCVFAVLFAWWHVVAARTWKVDEVPIPYLQDSRRYVSNPEEILSAAAVDSIDRLLFALERDKGIQTVVMVLDRIDGGDAYDFAMRVARKYGVGSKEKRTGLVVLLAVGDRKYQFLTGNGLEGTLPDAMIQRIEDRIFVPLLKSRDWDAAMVKAMTAIDQVCRGDDSLTKANPSGEEGGGMFQMFVLLLIGAGFFGIIAYADYVKKQPRRCPNCGQNTYRRQGSRSGHKYIRGRRYLVQHTTYVCSSCGHTQTKREEHRDDDDDGTGLVSAILLGSMMNRRSGSYGGFSGGGLSSGSFGGGSFGGGGSGGSF